MAKQQVPGLVKQFVNIKLTGGVNKKSDAHQLGNGELLTADNVVFSAVDRQVTKRYGFQAIQPFGAPFQGGPFKALGCRDNVEPLVLGQNTLNRYNAAQNLSTSIPLQTQCRLDVQQLVASTGKSAFAWPPTHASIATDGQKYILACWQEPNLINTLMFYGIQDIATGNWIISPRSIENFYGYNYGNYTSYTAHQPKAHYHNGFFYISVVNVGQQNIYASFPQETPSYIYNAVMRLGELDLTNLAAGFQINGTAVEIGANLEIPVVTQPGALSYDMHIKGGKWILSGIGNTASNAYVFTGTVSTETNTNGYAYRAFKLTSQQSFYFSDPYAATTPNPDATAKYQGLHFAVKCDGPAATPFAVLTNSNVSTIDASFKMKTRTLALDQTNSVTYAAAFFPREPIDCMWNNGNLLCAFNTFGQKASVSLWTLAPDLSILATQTSTGPMKGYHVQLLSRIFIQPSGRVAFWIGAGTNCNDTIYNSAYCVEFENYVSSASNAVNARPVARTLYLQGAKLAYADRPWPCDVVRIPGTGKYVTLLTAVTEKPGGNQAAWRGYGTLNRVTVEFLPKRQVQVLSLPTGGNLVCGAYPLYYDGVKVTEAGFSAAPDYAVPVVLADYGGTPFGLPSVSTDGSLAGGVNPVTLSGYMEYYYVVCLCRRDAYGNVSRSAPSQTYTAVCPNPFNAVTFREAFYCSGGPTNDIAQDVTFEFYRSTQGSPGTYYYLGQVPVGTSFKDTQPDGSTAPSNNNSITKNRTVYTNSNELPNDPPPAIHHAVSSESRVYLIPADNRNVVWYSKQFSPNRTVEFCASLTMSEGLNSGQFEALAVLDQNLIIFKKDQILYTYGNGPDNTGSGGSFSPFQKIASDVGCIDPGSVAQIPDGIVFRSRRGIELLTRGLQVQYIGQNVEPLVQDMGTISSVVCMPGFTELRFVPATPGKPVLCYDYGAQRWSTFSNMAGVQATNMLGNYWHISADGALVNAETPGAYLDNGTPIVMTLETPEIPVGSGGAQGWGRAYRMALLGDFTAATSPADYALSVSFAYDHAAATASNYTDTIVFSTAMGLISGDSVYQFRASRLPRQVMQTLRLKIQDTGVAGQACGISDLALEVGSKNGLAKLGDQKTVGGK